MVLFGVFLSFYGDYLEESETQINELNRLFLCCNLRNSLIVDSLWSDVIISVEFIPVQKKVTKSGFISDNCL